jgi:hypothetical protein
VITIRASLQRFDWGLVAASYGRHLFQEAGEVALEYYKDSARIAVSWMDVVTTSGIAMGHAPDLDKIEIFRLGVGDAALALASGITTENAHVFAPRCK